MVIVPGSDGLEAQPIHSLLPFAYRYRGCRRETAASVADLHAGLRSHYPELTDDSTVDIVDFRLVEAAG